MAFKSVSLQNVTKIKNSSLTSLKFKILLAANHFKVYLRSFGATNFLIILLCRQLFMFYGKFTSCHAMVM
jgi:hypothetical protein